MDEIKVIEPDDRQIELLQELTAQNRIILEANCMLMQWLGTPNYFVQSDQQNLGAK